MITMRNITKSYQMGENVVHALRGLDLEVSEGEFLAIMGCLLYTSPSPRDRTRSRMPSSA